MDKALTFQCPTVFDQLPSDLLDATSWLAGCPQVKMATDLRREFFA
jgi:hypothetical protein